MTRIEAGRKALAMAKKITNKVVDAKNEAKTVKAQQSDQGITNRVLNREPREIDPEKMTLEEKEEWLLAMKVSGDLMWRMGEGNPHQTNDHTTGGKPIPLLFNLKDAEGNIQKEPETD